VNLDARAFASYDVAKKSWVIDPGKFTIRVGDSVDSLELEGAVELTQDAANSTF
jgi:beta-glucosidase